MVSIKDVARAAGVSPQTVSNSINNPSIVKEATQQLVQQAIRELGYTPNASARRLRMQRSNTIAIGIAPVNYSRVYDRLLHALVTEADKHDIRVLLYKTDSKQDEIRQFTNLTAGADVDAFILTDTTHQDPRIAWLIEHDQTFVLFGRPWGVPNMYDPVIPWVDVDGQFGIAEITRHLIVHGHKTIGFIGWTGLSGTGIDRFLGWKNAMLEAKMATEEELAQLCVEAEDSLSDGHRACTELLKRHPNLDAIVCVSDTLASGAIMALPAYAKNITITGFDNTDTSQSLNFSSIEQPLLASAHEIIRIIQHNLSDDADHESHPRQHILIKPHIVTR